MNPFRTLKNWIDADWERRRYLPTSAIAQKLLWLSPLLLFGLIDEVFGVPPGSNAAYWGWIIVGVTTALLFMFSMWRWMVGYARPSWHEEQAQRRREAKKSGE